MGGDGGPNPQGLFDYAKSEMARRSAINKAIKQFIPSQHDVAKKSKRPDKTIFVPTGEVDSEGKAIYLPDLAPVSRVPLKLQEYIISQKASFAKGNGVTLKPSIDNSKVFERVNNNWKENKTNFDLKEIAERKMGETQVAVIFYSDKKEGAVSLDDFRFKYKIVSPLKGDMLYPFFDEDTDDFIAFGREYKRGKDNRFDFYIMNSEGICEIWKYVNKKPKMIDKIVEIEGETIEESLAKESVHDVVVTGYTALPVVYWEQDEGECNGTDELATELETAFSDFLTQMGYSADPILFAKGKAMDMPAKGSAGKFIESDDPEADLKYITPDNATEARDLSFKMLTKFFFGLNRAVLLDMETMKGLGTNISGSALERLLTDPYMNATDMQQGEWGKGIQRMVNFMLSQWKRLMNDKDPELKIECVFSKYSLQDDKERIEVSMAANGGLPVVDHETSIVMAGVVDDAKKTLDKINAQPKQGAAAPTNIPTIVE